MSETAVGLFLNKAAADAVVNALQGIGFPSSEVRTLTGVGGGSVESSTSTPLIDFESALTRELRSMGATDSECHTYLSGLRHGEVLVFATGTAHQMSHATEIMNEYAAIEVEEFVGAAPTLAGAGASHSFSGPHNISAKEDRVRANTTGAKVFSW